jgi:hypothetical protein
MGIPKLSISRPTHHCAGVAHQDCPRSSDSAQSACAPPSVSLLPPNQRPHGSQLPAVARDRSAQGAFVHRLRIERKRDAREAELELDFSCHQEIDALSDIGNLAPSPSLMDFIAELSQHDASALSNPIPTQGACYAQPPSTPPTNKDGLGGEEKRSAHPLGVPPTSPATPPWTKGKKSKLSNQVHVDLIKNLPAFVSHVERSGIRIFFIYLETKNLCFTQLRGPQDGTQSDLRPQALEDFLIQHKRDVGRKITGQLNLAFRLNLRGKKTAAACAIDEAHQTLRDDLIASRKIRSNTVEILACEFFAFLEQKKVSARELHLSARASPSTQYQPRLMELMDQATKEGVLTKKSCGLLVSILAPNFSTNLIPAIPIKQLPEDEALCTLLNDLSDELPEKTKLAIRRFFVQLEKQGKSYAQLCQHKKDDPSYKRPMALEREVNSGIEEKTYPHMLRSMLNAGFGWELCGVSNELGLPKWMLSAWT